MSNLRSTKCAIHGCSGNDEVLYKANFKDEDFNVEIFSARRLPDRIHYQLVRCKDCGLVRSDPVLTDEALKLLYEDSEFTYDKLVENLIITYGHYVSELERFGAKKGHILEVGCGNGFLLERCLELGYKEVSGVEPSKDAITKAPEKVQGKIKCDILRDGIFPDNTFDVICFFQMFDHVPDPDSFMRVCHKILKPGGLVMGFNHNVESFSAKLLGERSPIFDIEHIYLFSLKTMPKIFEQAGFETVHCSPTYNRVAIEYLFRLFPFPMGLKKLFLKMLDNPVGRIPVRIPLGNLWCIGRKPE